MKNILNAFWLSMLLVPLAAGPTLAGRGGMGGFHGGGAPVGGFHGGGAPVGGYSGGYHGAAPAMSGHAAWNASAHAPSSNVPRVNATRPNTVPPTHVNPTPGNWSHYAPQSGTGARPSTIGRPAITPNIGQHVAPGPGPHPGPGPGPHPGPDPHHHPDWYHGDWHDHWDHPWYARPIGWWPVGFVAGADLIAPWTWGYWSYSNPYCSAPVVIDNTTIDYAQPLTLAAAPADVAAPATTEFPPTDAAAPSDQAMNLLDAARGLFMQGDYAAALTQCDKAVAKLPNDPVLHEFRGLALFALKRYREAAAPVYAALSVGPGWDWTTLSGFYSDADVYAKQLHDLEQYVNAHPNDADVRFLLAYHYLTCGYADAAAEQLKAAVALNPKDQLSAQLLAALKTTAPPEPPAPGAPAKPLDAAGLAGDWKAARPDGSAITLQIAKDGHYSWQYDREGKTQTFNGEYALADNVLILKQNGNPVMVGQVTSLGGDRFNFKLPGDNPNDPGLTFAR